MKESMSNTDKILYYGVWGSVIGVGIYYGFNLFRGIFSPLVIQIVGEVYSAFPETPPFVLFSLNILHAIISTAPIALVAVVIITKLLRSNSLKYSIIPSVTVLLFSYWGNIVYIKNHTIAPLEYYPAVTINPIIVVLTFVGIFWGINKVNSSNM